eukprot:scaffold5106_cov248-Pinguiococcus_pyrenoidosus.AAC.4
MRRSQHEDLEAADHELGHVARGGTAASELRMQDCRQLLAHRQEGGRHGIYNMDRQARAHDVRCRDRVHKDVALGSVQRPAAVRVVSHGRVQVPATQVQVADGLAHELRLGQDRFRKVRQRSEREDIQQLALPEAVPSGLQNQSARAGQLSHRRHIHVHGFGKIQLLPIETIRRGVPSLRKAVLRVPQCLLAPRSNSHHSDVLICGRCPQGEAQQKAEAKGRTNSVALTTALHAQAATLQNAPHHLSAPAGVASKSCARHGHRVQVRGVLRATERQGHRVVQIHVGVDEQTSLLGARQAEAAQQRNKRPHLSARPKGVQNAREAPEVGTHKLLMLSAWRAHTEVPRIPHQSTNEHSADRCAARSGPAPAKISEAAPKGPKEGGETSAACAADRTFVVQSVKRIAQLQPAANASDALAGGKDAGSLRIQNSFQNCLHSLLRTVSS